ncbi:MAG: DUF1428 domain-containing protein [Gammaproteobacteria bacterium]|nr:DUF1428 domain-containing protein [Gammaproteobacteria bacterium]MDP2141506.1 DUF1428 domain-containing protein [Gammaproteobacteria bacterium]MDP2347469.1 DUF1428 domain-containing protein [Gammaproteobacteria bacterium]
MPKYVDGFVIRLPKEKVSAYKKMAQLGAKVWMEHGALEYRECVAEDTEIPYCKSFTQLTRAKAEETVVFAWILYRNKKHRDLVNKRVMADPRMQIPPTGMPFDPKNMVFSGFEVLVEKTQ